VFFFSNIETAITYPFAADRAKVKVIMGFQICLVKGGAVFVSPQQFQRILIFYNRTVGKVAFG